LFCTRDRIFKIPTGKIPLREPPGVLVVTWGSRKPAITKAKVVLFRELAQGD